MSSRFVSAGAINPSTGEVTAPEAATTESAPAPAPSTQNPNAPAPSKKSQEWLLVQAELEAKKTGAITAPVGIGPNGQEQKSLYEVLQANKAAKQAAFEEANKIKNQFRALDDDEIEFLQGVAERKRREEKERRKEEEGGLRKFKDAGTGGGRKRRRGAGEGKRLVPGVKRVKSGSGEGEKKEEEGSKETKTVVLEPAKATATAAAPAKKPLGGLVSYASSDEDDD
ncbi:N-terminal domain of NEFA-interacting nuclear protein NIP30-domain-containing protein [Pseudoneurospora amorphoporcata]|uniref:N-terminal domain of NEFA-interacting nuclear protein NIP30-domain-containing protein n=1 Tax=Pseudoneurospora amorphoporcata TaxID=241081 RepID=A0AAN6SGA3_9PEZI|nr:N-terminal domain of NEFA-interacting nuclear protein NIP30-domain-containing protein [Pseudoneurospora amorphoporcata]